MSLLSRANLQPAVLAKRSLLKVATATSTSSKGFNGGNAGFSSFNSGNNCLYRLYLKSRGLAFDCPSVDNRSFITHATALVTCDAANMYLVIRTTGVSGTELF